MGEAKQKLEAKKKKFEESPEEFVHLDDLALAIKADPDNGMAILINTKMPRHVLERGLVKLQYQAFAMFQQMDYMAAQERQKTGIVTPGGGNGRIQT